MNQSPNPNTRSVQFNSFLKSVMQMGPQSQASSASNQVFKRGISMETKEEQWLTTGADHNLFLSSEAASWEDFYYQSIFKWTEGRQWRCCKLSLSVPVPNQISDRVLGEVEKNSSIAFPDKEGHSGLLLLNGTFAAFQTEVFSAAKLLQSRPTLCDPIDSSPPGSPVPGILQARPLEWVAIAFSKSLFWVYIKDHQVKTVTV